LLERNEVKEKWFVVGDFKPRALTRGKSSASASRKK